MTGQRPPLGVTRVGVSVEVDHRDASPPHVTSDSRDVGPGDGVVPTQHHGHHALGRDGGDARFQGRERRRHLSRVHLDVPEVHDAQIDQGIDAEREARGYSETGGNHDFLPGWS